MLSSHTSFMELLHQLHDPEGLKTLIAAGGYFLLFAIIFAETGLLVGFFLPGDSLLFVAGTLCAINLPGHDTPILNIFVLIPLLCVAAISGDATGYFIGRKVGPKLFNRPDSRFFKREYVEKTEAFYAKHGPKTIVLARFMPFVRTFAPTVAGVAQMEYSKFAFYNVAGGIGWICICTLLGYFLGTVPAVKDNMEKAIMLIVFLSIAPIFVHWVIDRLKGAKPVEAVVETVAPGVDVE